MSAMTQQRGKGRPRTFDRASALHQALGVFWLRGYESTTIAELCSAMEINPPSLYAAFGNKAALFMEAVQHYEKVYWEKPWEYLHATEDLRTAIAGFFDEAAFVLSSREAPCGCLVTLSAPNAAADPTDLNVELRRLREETFNQFLKRLLKAKDDRDLIDSVDAHGLAYLFTTLLHGMSIQARDGASREQLVSVGQAALAVLPARKNGNAG